MADIQVRDEYVVYAIREMAHRSGRQIVLLWHSQGRVIKMGLRAVVGDRMAVAAAFVGGHLFASAGVAASSSAHR